MATDGASSNGRSGGTTSGGVGATTAGGIGGVGGSGATRTGGAGAIGSGGVGGCGVTIAGELPGSLFGWLFAGEPVGNTHALSTFHVQIHPCIVVSIACGEAVPVVLPHVQFHVQIHVVGSGAVLDIATGTEAGAGDT